MSCENYNYNFFYYIYLNVIVQILAFQRKQPKEYYFVQLNTQYQIVEQKKLEVRIGEILSNVWDRRSVEI